MSKEKDRARIKEIFAILIKYGIKDGIKSITSPVKLRLALEELGPTFVKIGQILSTRPDILPEKFIMEFQKLQDAVKPEASETVKKIVEDSLNCQLNEVFLTFEMKPVASASMAVVHKAVLKNGDVVVVKIQRPGIAVTMTEDIDILRKLARIAKYSQQGSVINIQEVVDELWVTMRKELDFINEADNLDKFKENHKYDKYVTCPKVYREYCRTNILVMEYMPGIKIGNIQELKNEGYDLDDLAKKLANNYFKQVFEDGFFHSDPHPGNIILSNKKITYIDFGQIGVISKNIREKFNEFLYGAATRNIDMMMYSLLKIGIKRGSVDTRKLYSDIESLYNTYIEANLGDIDLPQLLDEVFKAARKNNLAMPSDITMLLKGMVTIEGVVMKLSPELNIMDIAIPFVKKLMLKKKNYKDDFFEQLESAYLLAKSGLKIPVRTLELINSAIAGKLKIQMEHTNLENTMNDLNKMINRLIFGIITSALIMGSALVVNADVGPRFFNLPAIGVIGFVGAVVLGLLLLISIFRSGKM